MVLQPHSFQWQAVQPRRHGGQFSLQSSSFPQLAPSQKGNKVRIIHFIVFLFAYISVIWYGELCLENIVMCMLAYVSLASLLLLYGWLWMVESFFMNVFSSLCLWFIWNGNVEYFIFANAHFLFPLFCVFSALVLTLLFQEDGMEGRPLCVQLRIRWNINKTLEKHE